MYIQTSGDVSFPIIESVRERDIDLLILEELYAQESFNSLFLNVLNKKDFTFVRAYRSMTMSGLGETDIQIEYTNNKGYKLYVLVENKVGAEFQPAQYERYLMRANLLKSDTTEAYVILTAPESYIKQKSDFEYHLSYEQIILWYGEKDFDKNRFIYKQELLHLAVEQERRGYQIVRDEQVTQFWKQYYLYLEEHLPELKMSAPKAKPSQSSFAYFHPKWLPENTRLIHKMNKGYLDFELSGQANSYNEIITKYGHHLSDDMGIVVTNKSLVIRTETKPIDFEKPFEEQIEILQEVIQNTLILKIFIEKHFII